MRETFIVTRHMDERDSYLHVEIGMRETFTFTQTQGQERHLPLHRQRYERDIYLHTDTWMREIFTFTQTQK